MLKRLESLSRYQRLLILSTTIFLISIPFLPNIFDRFQISIEYHQQFRHDYYNNYFYDLDYDGLDERIYLSKEETTPLSFKVYEKTTIVKGQYNYSGLPVPGRNSLSFGDYDNNGLAEIYLITIDNDSLFLDAIEFKSEKKIITRKFLTLALIRDGELDFQITVKGIYDLDGDGYGEFIFSFYAYFSKQPRCIYAININKDRTSRTPFMGAPFGRSFIIEDFDQDGRLELIERTHASGNYSLMDSIPFSDNSSWLMIFNNHLDFKWQPIEVPEIYSTTRIDSIIKTKNGLLLPILTRRKGFDNWDYRIYTLNPSGEFQDSIQLNVDLKHVAQLVTINNRILVVTTGKIIELNHELKVIQEKEIGAYWNLLGVFDLDQDGSREIIFQNPESTLFTVMDTDFKTIDFTLPNTPIDPLVIEPFKDHISQSKTSIQTGEDWYILTYKNNTTYYYQYLIYIGAYLLLMLVFIFGVKYRNYRRLAFDKRIVELQLRALKNQIDPHFTFNAINSIGASIHRGEKDKSIEYFSKFSKMLRSILQHGNSMFVPLDEELRVVKYYIELEHLRFKQNLKWKLDICKGVDLKQLVPRLLLQMQVENAIKHGIQSVDGIGHLKIKIHQENRVLTFQIEDDGIGRHESKSTNGTGNGKLLTSEILELYKKIVNQRIVLSTNNAGIREGQPFGTIVKIQMPIYYGKN